MTSGRELFAIAADQRLVAARGLAAQHHAPSPGDQGPGGSEAILRHGPVELEERQAQAISTAAGNLRGIPFQVAHVHAAIDALVEALAGLQTGPSAHRPDQEVPHHVHGLVEALRVSACQAGPEMHALLSPLWGARRAIDRHTADHDLAFLTLVQAARDLADSGDPVQHPPERGAGEPVASASPQSRAAPELPAASRDSGAAQVLQPAAAIPPQEPGPGPLPAAGGAAVAAAAQGDPVPAVPPSRRDEAIGYLRNPASSRYSSPSSSSEQHLSQGRLMKELRAMVGRYHDPEPLSSESRDLSLVLRIGAQAPGAKLLSAVLEVGALEGCKLLLARAGATLSDPGQLAEATQRLKDLYELVRAPHTSLEHAIDCAEGVAAALTPRSAGDRAGPAPGLAHLHRYATRLRDAVEGEPSADGRQHSYWGALQNLEAALRATIAQPQLDPRAAPALNAALNLVHQCYRPEFSPELTGLLQQLFVVLNLIQQMYQKESLRNPQDIPDSRVERFLGTDRSPRGRSEQPNPVPSPRSRAPVRPTEWKATSSAAHSQAFADGWAATADARTRPLVGDGVASPVLDMASLYFAVQDARTTEGSIANNLRNLERAVGTMSQNLPQVQAFMAGEHSTPNARATVEFHEAFLAGSGIDETTLLQGYLRDVPGQTASIGSRIESVIGQLSHLAGHDPSGLVSLALAPFTLANAAVDGSSGAEAIKLNKKYAAALHAEKQHIRDKLLESKADQTAPAAEWVRARDAALRVRLVAIDYHLSRVSRQCTLNAARALKGATQAALTTAGVIAFATGVGAVVAAPLAQAGGKVSAAYLQLWAEVKRVDGAQADRLAAMTQEALGSRDAPPPENARQGGGFRRPTMGERALSYWRGTWAQDAVRSMPHADLPQRQNPFLQLRNVARFLAQDLRTAQHLNHSALVEVLQSLGLSQQLALAHALVLTSSKDIDSVEDAIHALLIKLTQSQWLVNWQSIDHAPPSRSRSVSREDASQGPGEDDVSLHMDDATRRNIAQWLVPTHPKEAQAVQACEDLAGVCDILSGLENLPEQAAVEITNELASVANDAVEPPGDAPAARLGPSVNPLKPAPALAQVHQVAELSPRWVLGAALDDARRAAAAGTPAFDAELKARGCRVADAPRDGNCLIHAVYQQAVQDPGARCPPNLVNDIRATLRQAYPGNIQYWASNHIEATEESIEVILGVIASKTHSEPLQIEISMPSAEAPDHRAPMGHFGDEAGRRAELVYGRNGHAHFESVHPKVQPQS